MAQYKVVKEFKIEEVAQIVDSVIELTEAQAQPLLDSGEIVVVTEDGGEASQAGSNTEGSSDADTASADDANTQG